MNDLEKIRNEYTQKSLSKKDIQDDPIKQFEVWFNEILKSDTHEPTACTLSTIGKGNRPSGRIVLLKGYNHDGFVFYTNYTSRKGKELGSNPYACLTFFWKELERQVRVEGKVSKTTEDESEKYFKSRPLGSQIGAFASPQSEKIPNRKYLEAAQLKVEKTYGADIPRPQDWGGYRLVPDYLEFWQGRSNRLHDRIVYEWKNESWVIDRLAP